MKTAIIPGDSKWQIELSGQVEAVSAAKTEVQRVIDSIKCEKKEIDKPGENVDQCMKDGRTFHKMTHIHSDESWTVN